MVTLMEVAVYAAVMANGAPLSCTAEDHVHVYCSNGIAAELGDGSAIRYSNGVTVTRDDSGFPTFSDGTRSWWSAAGWLAFSNGVQIRKQDLDAFRFNSGMECKTALPELVQCRLSKPG